VSNSTIGYGWLSWRRAVSESDLPATAKHILLVLSLYPSDMNPAPFPSLKTLGKMCSRNPEVVRRNLKIAQDAGWVVREPRFVDGRQTSNSFRMALPGVPLQNVGGDAPTQSSGSPPTLRRGEEGDKKERVGSSEEEPIDPKVVKKRKVKTAIPNDWTPTDSHREKAAEYGVDCDWQAEKFRSYHESRGNKFASHNAAFTTWLINAKEFRAKDGGSTEEADSPMDHTRRLHAQLREEEDE